MRLKILPLITGGALFIGALALQACGDSSGYAYGPGGYGPGYASSYGYAPTYVEPAPVYASPGYAPGYAYAGDGDYDEQHVWRERDWWVNNRRDWVMAHHQAWLNHERAEGQAQATYRNQVQRHSSGSGTAPGPAARRSAGSTIILAKGSRAQITSRGFLICARLFEVAR